MPIPSGDSQVAGWLENEGQKTCQTSSWSPNDQRQRVATARPGRIPSPWGVYRYFQQHETGPGSRGKKEGKKRGREWDGSV